MGSTSGKSIKKKQKEHPEVLPYNELYNVDLNFEKLIDIDKNNMDKEKKMYYENEHLESEKKYVPISQNEIDKDKQEIFYEDDSDKLVSYFESKLNNHEKKYLSRQFLNYSSDGIISNRQFWTFLDLQNIYNTTFAKCFYKAACGFKENIKLDHLRFMDYSKFIQFVVIFTKKGKLNNNEDLHTLRIKFIYNIFDHDGNNEIDRLEFRNILTSFVEALLLCKFDSKNLQEKVDFLNFHSKNSSMIEKILDLYVDEIYSSSYNQDHLTFDEWEKWLKKIDGIDNFLNFSGCLK